MPSTKKQNQTKDLYPDLKEELTVSDFIMIGNWNEPYYFSYEWRNIYEICIEPCFNGFDIAIYRSKHLLEPKQCTNLPESNNISVALGIAITIADKLYKTYTK